MSFPFRYGVPILQRTRIINTIISNLRELASQHNLAVSSDISTIINTQYTHTHIMHTKPELEIRMQSKKKIKLSFLTKDDKLKMSITLAKHKNFNSHFHNINVYSRIQYVPLESKHESIITCRRFCFASKI